MKANESDILKIVNEADILVDSTELKNDIPLIEQGVDSLDIVNIYLLIEEKFGIKIPDEELDNVRTINQIIEYVNSN